MDYYVYMLVSLAIMLIGIKFVFCEMEGRTARKKGLLSWYLKLSKPFKYVRTRSIILMSAFCYMFVSAQSIFSIEWLIELVGFVAVGVVFDGISQFAGHYFNKFRFKKDINKALVTKEEINKAIELPDNDLVQQSIPTYSSKEIVSRYLNEQTHLAAISFDGGEYVSSFEKLPPITYAVEAQFEKAEEKLSNQSVKVTKLTSEGKLPFKDERLDVVVNELTNYDKYDLYRVVKPGGYILVNQMGSDNYQELINTFLPIRLRERWDLESSSKTLSEIGLEIVDGVEEHGYVRFNTLTSFIHFMKKITRSDITQDRFINFYGYVLKQIKEKNYFELTTHRFMVVARKKEL